MNCHDSPRLHILPTVGVENIGFAWLIICTMGLTQEFTPGTNYMTAMVSGTNLQLNIHTAQEQRIWIIDLLPETHHIHQSMAKNSHSKLMSISHKTVNASTFMQWLALNYMKPPAGKNLQRIGRTQWPTFHAQRL